MFPKPIQEIVARLSSLPSIGPRQASRLAFYLLKRPAHELQSIAKAILALQQDINLCGRCFYVSERKDKLCEICADTSRDRSVVCVVEKETDAATIEKTGAYKGLYHILGGMISNLSPESHKKLRVNELFKRVKEKRETERPVKEVILAFNPTPEGDMTALYLEKELRASGAKITRLGRGLPNGADMEFADEETLGEALASRKSLKYTP